MASRGVGAKRGVVLDISREGEPQAGSVSLRRDLRGIPTLYRTKGFPLEDDEVISAVVTHVLEYVQPEDWFRWWDELWRVMKPGSLVYVSGPYGGDESHGWVSDPTHRIRVVEGTFAWADPRTPFYARYRPKPWVLEGFSRVPGPHGSVGYNAVVRKVRLAVEKPKGKRT